MPAAAVQAAISQASWTRVSRRLRRRVTSFWSGGSVRITERCLGRRGSLETSRAMTIQRQRLVYRLSAVGIWRILSGVRWW